VKTVKKATTVSIIQNVVQSMIVSSVFMSRSLSALGSCQSNLNATEDFGPDGPTALLPTA
jgi:hypothetical protein